MKHLKSLNELFSPQDYYQRISLSDYFIKFESSLKELDKSKNSLLCWMNLESWDMISVQIRFV